MTTSTVERPWEWTAHEADPPPEPVDLSGLEVPAWFEDAACQDADPDVFFPEKGQASEPAIEVCRRCRVREQCLDYALWDLGPRVDYGVWGGTSQRERRQLRKDADTRSCVTSSWL